jgi:hypothetical protein
VTPAYVDVPLCADVIRYLPLGAIAAHARKKQVASATVLRQVAITADTKNPLRVVFFAWHSISVWGSVVQ